MHGATWGETRLAVERIYADARGEFATLRGTVEGLKQQAASGGGAAPPQQPSAPANPGSSDPWGSSGQGPWSRGYRQGSAWSAWQPASAAPQPPDASPGADATAAGVPRQLGRRWQLQRGQFRRRRRRPERLGQLWHLWRLGLWLLGQLGS